MQRNFFRRFENEFNSNGDASIVGFTPNQLPGFLAYWDGIAAFGGSSIASLVPSWNTYTGTTLLALAQATSTKQPVVSPMRDGIIFDGIDDVLTAAFTYNNPQSVFIVAQLLTSALNKYTFDGTIVNNMALNQTNAAGDQRIYSQANGPNVTVGNQPFVISMVYKNAAARIRLNGGTAVAGSVANNNAGGLTLGASAVPNNWGHVLVKAIILCNRAIDVPNELKTVAYLMARYQSITLGNLNVVFEGDSRMALYTIPAKVGAYIRAATYTGTITATGGETAANIATQVSQTTALFNGAKINIAVYLAGVNDNRGGDQLPTNIYNQISTWVTAVKAANPTQKVIILTEIDSQEAASLTNNWSTVRSVLNTLILNNAVGADKVCNIGNFSIFNDATKTAWYDADKIHLKPQSDAVIALQLLESIRQIALGI